MRRATILRAVELALHQTVERHSPENGTHQDVRPSDNYSSQLILAFLFLAFYSTALRLTGGRFWFAGAVSLLL